MNELRLENVRALDPPTGRIASCVSVRAGRISALDPRDPPAADAVRVDGGGRRLTPGLIDLHTHGLLGFRYDQPGAVAPAAAQLARFGTTTVLPTLWAGPAPDLPDRIAQVARAAASATGARADLLHLEGPFLALPGAGGEGAPGDTGLLAEILAAGRGQVRAMSISPEQPGILPVIERMVAAGVRVFITHTRADVEQTRRAIDAGARHATHFYNVFHLPGEADAGCRPVGAVEAILADPRCTVDFIADGVHVHPAAIGAALAAKGWRGVAAATDSNSGAGRPPGLYPQGFRAEQLRVCPEGGCRVHAPGTARHGVLAGSALTLDRAVANLRRWIDQPEACTWAMVTSVPAAIAGLTDRGTLRRGADADLVLWDEAPGGPRAWRTWIRGIEIIPEEAADAG